MVQSGTPVPRGATSRSVRAGQFLLEVEVDVVEGLLVLHLSFADDLLDRVSLIQLVDVAVVLGYPGVRDVVGYTLPCRKTVESKTDIDIKIALADTSETLASSSSSFSSPTSRTPFKHKERGFRFKCPQLEAVMFGGRKCLLVCK